MGNAARPELKSVKARLHIRMKEGFWSDGVLITVKIINMLSEITGIVSNNMIVHETIFNM